MRDTLNLYLLNNPIAAAELLRLRRTQITARRWRRWLNRLVLYVALGLSLLLYGGYLWITLSHPLTVDQTPIFSFMESFGRAPAVLMVITFVWYLVLLLQTLGVASQSITREKAENTWDLVLMTDVTPARLVWGKWWGVVHRQVRPFAMLTVLWLGVASWMSIFNSPAYYFYRYPLSPADTLITSFPHPLMILFTSALIGLLMLLNLGLTAACGLAGGVLSRRWGGAVTSAIVIRILLIVVPFVSFLLLARYLWAWNRTLTDVVGLGIVPLADSGLNLVLADPLAINFEWSGANNSTSQSYPQPPLYLPLALGVSVLLFVLPVVLLQSLAVWRIARQ